MAVKLKKRNCSGCGAEPGAYHDAGCGQEQCAKCGGQLLGCGCIGSRGPKRRLPWTGLNLGVAECHEYGYFCVRNPIGTGYIPSHPDAPGATEDINRLVSECRWDAKAARFVRD